MNDSKPPAPETKDDHAHNADILKQDPKKPHYLNSPLHVPKLSPGVANVEDVTVRRPINGAAP